MTTQQNSRGSRAASVRRIASSVALAAFGLAACSPDEILNVEDPDVIRPEAVAGAANLPAYLAGAIGDFQVAFAGSSGLEGFVQYTGLLSDELINTETFNTRLEMDRRSINDDNSNNLAVFQSIARSRRSAEEAARQYTLYQPVTAADTASFRTGRAEALAYAGYTYLMFVEMYCAGVPVVDVDDQGEIIPSAGLSRLAMLQRAKQRFDTALTLATQAGAGGANLANLARVGRARTFINMAGENTSSAARAAMMDSAFAAAATVPTSFRWNVQHSENTGRQNNGVWSFMVGQRRWGVANSQGGAATGGNVGLPYRTLYTTANATTATDVRTAFGPGVAGFDNVSTLFPSLKYPARTSVTLLASGLEARLHQAEVELFRGNVANWLAIHNALRTATGADNYNVCATNAVGCTNPAVGALGALVDPGTPEARIRTQFAEKAYWLFLTGHRLGDMRRMIRTTQYGLTAASVWPSGRYEKPGTNAVYGTDVSFPIPVQERANSAFEPREGPTCDNSATAS